MNLRLPAMTLAAGLLLAAFPSFAQSGRLAFERFPSISAFDGRGPGLDPALMLTPDQKERIAAARHEIMEVDPVVAALKLGRTRDQTDEVRAARNTVEAARAKFEERVEGILSAEQKTLLHKVSAAAEEVQKQVQEEFRPRLAGLSRDDKAVAEPIYREARQKMEAEFAKRLDTLLTPAQKAAVDEAVAAAKAEADRAAAARRAQ